MFENSIVLLSKFDEIQVQKFAIIKFDISLSSFARGIIIGVLRI